MNNNLILQAEVAVKKYKFKEALAIYRQIIDQDPQNALAYQGIGLALVNLGDNAEAHKMSIKALDLDSNLVIPHTVLAHIYDEAGDREKSWEEARIAIQICPESSDALCRIGILYLFSKDLDTAQMYLEKAVKVDPSNYLAQYNLAAVYQTKRDEKKLFRQTVILFTLKPNVKNVLRFMYLQPFRASDFMVLVISIFLIPFWDSRIVLFTTILLMLIWFLIGLYSMLTEQTKQWRQISAHFVRGIIVGIFGGGLYLLMAYSAPYWQRLFSLLKSN